jgi:hypothetical protein
MPIYIFAYGALLDVYKNKRSWPVVLNGFKRTLNVQGQKHLVFGLKKSSTSTCNGLLLKVDEKELDQLVLREKLYTLKPLPKENLTFPYTPKPLKFEPTDELFYFAPEAKYVLTKKAAEEKPRPTAYLNRCLKGAAAQGPAFLQDFLDST